MSKKVENEPVGEVPVHVLVLFGPGAAFANACVWSKVGFVKEIGVVSGVVAEKSRETRLQARGLQPSAAWISCRRPSATAPVLCEVAGGAP